MNPIQKINYKMEYWHCIDKLCNHGVMMFTYVIAGSKGFF